MLAASSTSADDDNDEEARLPCMCIDCSRSCQIGTYPDSLAPLVPRVRKKEVSVCGRSINTPAGSLSGVVLCRFFRGSVF